MRLHVSLQRNRLDKSFVANTAGVRLLKTLIFGLHSWFSRPLESGWTYLFAGVSVNVMFQRFRFAKWSIANSAWKCYRVMPVNESHLNQTSSQTCAICDELIGIIFVDQKKSKIRQHMDHTRLGTFFLFQDRVFGFRGFFFGFSTSGFCTVTQLGTFYVTIRAHVKLSSFCYSQIYQPKVLNRTSICKNWERTTVSPVV